MVAHAGPLVATRKGRLVRIVVGVSGASGIAYALATLRALREAGVEIHLVMSPASLVTMRLETGNSPKDFESLADAVYRDDDLGATIASGSFLHDGMLVVPCSMKSASAIAYSLADTLLTRAADVTLKERRKLVLVLRETPLHLGHLRTLTQLAEMGAVILPAIPGMYARPKTVEDVIAHTVGKALDQFSIPHALFKRWDSRPPQPAARRARRRPDGRR